MKLPCILTVLIKQCWTRIYLPSMHLARAIELNGQSLSKLCKFSIHLFRLILKKNKGMSILLKKLRCFAYLQHTDFVLKRRLARSWGIQTLRIEQSVEQNKDLLFSINGLVLLDITALKACSNVPLVVCWRCHRCLEIVFCKYFLLW